MIFEVFQLFLLFYRRTLSRTKDIGLLVIGFIIGLVVGLVVRHAAKNSFTNTPRQKDNHHNQDFCGKNYYLLMCTSQFMVEASLLGARVELLLIVSSMVVVVVQ